MTKYLYNTSNELQSYNSLQSGAEGIRHMVLNNEYNDNEYNIVHYKGKVVWLLIEQFLSEGVCYIWWTLTVQKLKRQDGYVLVEDSNLIG